MSHVRWSGVNVVVVDDHAAIRKLVTHLLQNWGLQVVGEASNGHEAVQECERLRPHVVLLDVCMPLLNGFGAALEIARLSPGTKIVFLTSHASQAYVDEAFHAGAVAFVSKASISRCLPEAIEAALQGTTYISCEGDARRPARGPVARISPYV